jgi:predicted nucleic acid-binding protein
MAWLDAQDPTSLWLTTITIGELEAGVGKLLPGARRSSLRDQLNGIADDFRGRVLPFDYDAAQFYGPIAGSILRVRKRIEHALDVLIAAIAMSHSAAVATRNVKHFDEFGIEVINPWDA